MPYNGSGVFIPATQPREPNTTILAADYNSDTNDIASGLSNAVTRDGQGAMSTQFKLVAGTVTVPGLAFSAATSTGIYTPSSSSMAFPVQGGEVMRLMLDGAERNVLIGAASRTGERLQVTGSTKLNGALNVTGASTFGGSSTFAGESTFNGSLTLKGALNTNGNITVLKTSPVITSKATTGIAAIDIDSVTGSQSLVRYKKDGINRWSGGISGGNNNFEISRYNSAGAFVDNPFVIEDATGRSVVSALFSPGLIQGATGLFSHSSGAQFSVTPFSDGAVALHLRTLGAANHAIIWATNSAANPYWALALKNGTNNNAFDVLRYNNTTGTYIDNPISVNYGTGAVTLNPTTVNGVLTASIGVTTGGNISASGGVFTNTFPQVRIDRTSVSGSPSLILSSGGTAIWDYRTTANGAADLMINRFAYDTWSTSLQIYRDTGAISLNGPTTINSTLLATGAISTWAGISAGAGVNAPSFAARTGAGVGSVVLVTGNTSRSGYMEFLSAGGVRQGYIGDSATTASQDFGDITYQAGFHRFFGTAVFNTTVSANISGTAAAANAVPWTGVSGRPTIGSSVGGATSRWVQVDGMMIQYSQVAVTVTGASSSYTVNFPRSFPNACHNVQATLLNSVAGYAAIKVIWMTASQCGITVTDAEEAVPGTVAVMVAAFGY